MGEDSLEFEENFTKMFAGKKLISSDEELAIDIFHRFNLHRDTMETMPAFEEHLKTMFCKEKKEE